MPDTPDTPTEAPSLTAEELEQKQQELHEARTKLQEVEADATSTDDQKAAAKKAVDDLTEELNEHDASRSATTGYATKKGVRNGRIVGGAAVVGLGALGLVGYNALSGDVDNLSGKVGKNNKAVVAQVTATMDKKFKSKEKKDAAYQKDIMAQFAKLKVPKRLDGTKTADGKDGQTSPDATPASDDGKPCPPPMKCPDGQKPGCVDDGCSKKKKTRTKKRARRAARRRARVVKRAETPCKPGEDLRAKCLRKDVNANTAGVKDNKDKLTVHQKALLLLGRTQDGVSQRLQKMLDGPPTTVKGRPAQNNPRRNRGNR
jgi:hypothetical protein